MGLVKNHSIYFQQNSIECHGEYRDYLNVILSIVMLSVVMLNVVRLSVVRLNVVMLCVVAP
jgi:hypothetical protein